jgi:hypothetical protein
MSAQNDGINMEDKNNTPILPYERPLANDDPFSPGLALLNCEMVGFSKIAYIDPGRSVRNEGFGIPAVPGWGQDSLIPIT